MKGKKEEIKKTRAIKNNIYAIRMLWSFSKERIIHTAMTTFIDFFAWVFYSAFFIRYLVGAIEKKQGFFSIFQYILLAGVFFMVTFLYSTFVEGTINPQANIKIYQSLYRLLYKKARNVELSCYEDNNFYTKYTLAVDGADEKLINLLNTFWCIIFGGVAAVTVFATMYSIDKIAVLFVIFPIVGNFVFGYFVNKMVFARDQALAPYKRRIDYVNRVMYLADYSKEMRLSKVFFLMKEKYQVAIDGIFETIDKYVCKIVLPLWFRNYFTYTIIFEGVMLYGGYRCIVSKTMSLADLAVLSSTMVSATWILIRFADNIMESMKLGLFIENLRTFLEYKEKLPEDFDGILPDEEIKTIEFRNVSFGYKEDEMIINNLSFAIEGKSSVAFVGHNGAGKTTIIKLLFRLYDPTEGEIWLNGHNIKEYNLQDYRRLFAAAFQDFQILALTIKENVLMRKVTDQDDDIVIEALKKAGVYNKIMTLPNGINTILTKEFDEQGALLSGGEYQKIIVARAFAKNSPIKVFDEPSSALDPIAEYELYENIAKDSIGKTMIFISHRLSSVRSADMVYMLENGSVLEHGTHEELMQLEGAYADMYLKQAKNYLAVENLSEVTA